MVETTNFLINIGIYEFIGIIFVVSGSLITIAWWSGGKFTELGIKIDGLDTRLTNIEGKSSGLIISKSPVGLTENGNKVLVDSGLKEYIDNKKEELLNACSIDHKFGTAYDVQVATFSYFEKIAFDLDFENKLKNYSFENGLDIDVLRRIGGIYFRDICLNKMKMDAKDIDKK